MNKLSKLGNENYYHIIFITEMGAQGEEKNGIAHLTEHVCLAPIFQWNKDNPSSPFEVYGETCLHYMFFYVAGRMEYKKWIDDWFNDILENRIITPRNLSFARKQVIWECNELNDDTSSYRQIVRFVSNGTIRNLPIGTVDSINSITKEDISVYLSRILFSNSIWTFTFNTSDELWLQYKHQGFPQISSLDSILLPQFSNEGFDSVLIIKNRKTHKPKAEYLLRLPKSEEKNEYLTLVFIECFLFAILGNANLPIIGVTEKFFSSDFGFLSFQLELSELASCNSRYIKHEALKKLADVRKIVNLYKHNIGFFEQEKKDIADEISQINSSKESRCTEDNWAQIMSNIVYKRPLFYLSDASDIWNYIMKQDVSILTVLEKFISMPAKIVVHMPV